MTKCKKFIIVSKKIGKQFDTLIRIQSLNFTRIERIKILRGRLDEKEFQKEIAKVENRRPLSSMASLECLDLRT